MKSALLPFQLILLATASGCVGNDQSLTIERFVPVDTMTCTVSPTDVNIQTQGLLDVGIVAGLGSPGYTVFPVVQNHLPVNLNIATDVEHHAIILNGINVELQPDASLAAAIPSTQRKFFVPVGAGRLEPAALVAIGVEIIPRAMALNMAKSLATGVGSSLPQVIAKLSPVGDYSGSTIVGAPVSFPIEVCNFCLSGAPQACPAGGFDPTTVKDGNCFEAQDLAITCCTSSQQLLCGTSVPLKMK